jgi:Ca-activated chloride channel family protein
MSRRTDSLLSGVLEKWALAFVVVLLATSVGNAGPIFIPGSMQEGAFVAEKEASVIYTVEFSDLSATIDGGQGKVRIRETIVGPEKAAKTVCLIPLPKGVSGEGVSISVSHGRALREIDTVRYLDAEAAQKLYESIAKQNGSVEIIALSGQPALLVPEVTLQGRLEMEVAFDATVQNSQGVSSIVCPMPATEWSAAPVSRVTLTATVKSDKPLRAMFSPSHEAMVKRNGLHEAVVRVKADDLLSSDEFRLCWVADENDLGLRVMAYREDDKEGGYFLLVGNPTGSDEGENSIDKEIIFVLDTSGSMRGEKIEQCRAAIEYCLTQLNSGDRFNIVTFGTDVTSFQESPVTRSPKTTAAAQSFVEGIIANGRTNIAGALQESLAGESQTGRPRIVIFLTDGTPTAGEQNADKILENIPQWNTSDSRVFVMGVGDDVNAHLLDHLAESTNGTSEYITPEEEIDAKVATLYDRLSHPVLTNVKVDFGALATDSVYPKTLPALFKGSEFMIFGRYRGGGRHTLSVNGMLNGVETKYTHTTDFPKDAIGDGNEFVAPLWAARNVGFLLQEIRLHGENEELLKEVVRLSKKFGIVTEYTEFLGSIGGGALSATAVLDESRSRVARANQFRSGRWAVQQARNDRDLQTKMVVGNAANVYLDRRGKKVGRENVYQLGARCFYLNNGQWCDAEETGDRKTRVVKLFSDDYFALLREHPEFAKAQKLGWAMSVNVGDERVVIEKEGKQQSEELLKRSQGQQQINQAPIQFDQRFQQQRGLNRINLLPRNEQQQILPRLQNQIRPANPPAQNQNEAPRREEQR